MPEPIKPTRARKTEKEPEPQTEQPAEPPAPGEPEVLAPDYGTMPTGKHAGKAWSEFTDDQLKAVMASDHAAFAAGHKAAVRAELEKRGVANE